MNFLERKNHEKKLLKFLWKIKISRTLMKFQASKKSKKKKIKFFSFPPQFK